MLLILTIKQTFTHGGARKGAGRKSIFRVKAVARPFAMDFTQEGRELLDALTRRTGLSRNGVIAVLVLQYADELTFDRAAGVVYADKAQLVLSIRMPKDAARKLKDARRRTGKSYSDLGEALVRTFGRTAHFPPPPPKVKR